MSFTELTPTAKNYNNELINDINELQEAIEQNGSFETTNSEKSTNATAIEENDTTFRSMLYKRKQFLIGF